MPWSSDARAAAVGAVLRQIARAPRRKLCRVVEAVRGSLGHWMAVRDGKIERYQIIAPTTWNFSPRDSFDVGGPLEQALVGTDVGDAGPRAVAIQHIVRSFDPSMACTTHGPETSLPAANRIVSASRVGSVLAYRS
ncbi:MULTISPECIES: nickel-dependent hydrogenase large subunit [unclassified Bradyrhizobium]|uniref:nickel-dependent hydrogenase large subunit n=1 Tax=unclassified Bradyrhizobium TaxID=2631580 RepID=UPI0033920115